MSETQQETPISDLDIEAAINHATTNYPPLMHDRHRVHITVKDGVVHVSGYVKAAPTYRYVLNRIGNVEGVKDVVVEDFHNDEEIRLHVGRVVPAGVMVNLEYGAVILSGQLPEGQSAEELVRKVALVSGVHRVLTAFE